MENKFVKLLAIASIVTFIIGVIALIVYACEKDADKKLAEYDNLDDDDDDYIELDEDFNII